MLGESPTKSNKTFMKARQGKRFKLSIKIATKNNHYERTKPKIQRTNHFQNYVWTVRHITLESSLFFVGKFEKVLSSHILWPYICSYVYINHKKERLSCQDVCLVQRLYRYGIATSLSQEFRWTYHREILPTTVVPL